jgi:hypothetical protein
MGGLVLIGTHLPSRSVQVVGNENQRRITAKKDIDGFWLSTLQACGRGSISLLDERVGGHGAEPSIVGTSSEFLFCGLSPWVNATIRFAADHAFS